MHITNVVSNAHLINEKINSLVLAELMNGSSTLPKEQLAAILKQVQSVVEKTNLLCKKNNGTPEDLPNPSFRAYQWMNFLSQRKWLFTHISAAEQYYTVLGDIFPRIIKRNYGAKIQIDSYYSGYLFRNRQKDGKVYLEINEGFVSAPTEIKQTILGAALKRRTTNRIKAIKAYTASAEYIKIQTALQINSGGNKLAGRGKNYDLATIFSKLNQEYFEGKLEQPRLMWSARKSIRRLGTYQPDSDTITINKSLDGNDIPHYLVEYVMYHEMLHKKIGLKEVNGRHYAHTKEFKKAEKRYRAYQQAEKAIKQLNQSARL